MRYLLAQELAEKWGVSKRRIQILCAQGRVPGAELTDHVWRIPENAEKPADARVSHEEGARRTLSVQQVRGSIKKLSRSLYQGLLDQGLGALQAKEAAILLLSTKLLSLRLHGLEEEKISEVAQRIRRYFGFADVLSEIDQSQLPLIDKHLMRVAPVSDDVLSWSYQYLNKEDKDSKLAATQFFTEKYMVSAIVERLPLSDPDGSVVDPACGSGNFLLHVLERICREGETPSDEAEFRQRLDRLYGYELDQDLAVVASINLRLKTLQLMEEAGLKPSLETFFDCVPRIYASVGDGKRGALDPDSARHPVRRVGTDTVTALDQVICGKKYVITNPPFQTVKGMPEDQKRFLKQAYPMAKCDMCSAFLQRCIEDTAPDGFCGLVTQTSWMYLDSFEELRNWLLDRCTITCIIELGADAFLDLSGEKANVALVVCRRRPPQPDDRMEIWGLSAYRREECVELLETASDHRPYVSSIPQAQICSAPKHRFSLSDASGLQRILDRWGSYRTYAVPMQGTSTGDAKKLVDYYWKHLGQREWVPVSKGGGYARWQGLNQYCVKWGEDGEYIRQMPGSALRNTSYFGQTQMVFSDTGTAGLNIRILRKGQIFIASGPGIRVTEGLPMAHLAFLNTKLATYFIRLLSPKLTVSAGYIGQLPVDRDILYSEDLDRWGSRCVSLKAERLSRHPCNLEFVPVRLSGTAGSIQAEALEWLRQDLASQREQLLLEREMDRFLAKHMGLSADDMAAVEKSVGLDLFSLPEAPAGGIRPEELDRKAAALLTESCGLSRTRPSKNVRGCDCLLEYLALETGVNCGMLCDMLLSEPEAFPGVQKRYQEAFLHALVLSVLGFRTDAPLPRLDLSLEDFGELLVREYPGLRDDREQVCLWVEQEFSAFHEKAFRGAPVFRFEKDSQTIITIEG